MNADQKMENVHAQVRAIHEVRTNVLNCPYCGVGIYSGDTFCCKLLTQAAMAALDRVHVEKTAEHVDKVLDKAGRN